MFDPFALPGPQFLAFYLALGVIVLLGLRALFRAMETTDEPRLPALADPYLIAHLRGGTKEALRVGIFSLADRGLLDVSTTGKLTTKRKNAVALASRPIEKAILARYVKTAAPGAIFRDGAALVASRDYRETLAKYRLVADREIYGRRLLPLLAALLVMVGSAVYKIQVALAQGRHNIGFLVVLAAVFTIAIVVTFARRRTARGTAILADLKRLFGRLRDRSSSLASGGRTNEAALVAAVFGIGVLSESSFPFLEKLYPRSSGGDSGGSSCSSGSSGCGGGGGGCGGCGS